MLSIYYGGTWTLTPQRWFLWHGFHFAEHADYTDITKEERVRLKAPARRGPMEYIGLLERPLWEGISWLVPSQWALSLALLDEPLEEFQ